jgi:energy-coupling factor transporter ATP-binding protein EcfA2
MSFDDDGHSQNNFGSDDDDEEGICSGRQAQLYEPGANKRKRSLYDEEYEGLFDGYGAGLEGGGGSDEEEFAQGEVFGSGGDRESDADEELGGDVLGRLRRFTTEQWNEMVDWVKEFNVNQPTEDECEEFLLKCTWVFDTFFTQKVSECALRYEMVFRSSVSIDRDYDTLISKICFVCEHMKEHRREQVDSVIRTEAGILSAIKNGYESQRAMMVVMFKQDNHFQRNGGGDGCGFNQFRDEVSEKKNHQWAYIHMLEIARSRWMRRVVVDPQKRVLLYQPNYVVYHGRKFFTQFFEPVMFETNMVQRPIEVAEFVNSQVFPVCSNAELLNALTKNSSAKSLVISNLRSLKTEYLPDLKRNRYWISFSNGVYDMDNDRFYWYDEDYAAERGLLSVKYDLDNDTGLSSVNYHDHFFNEVEQRGSMDSDSEYGEDSFMAIRTPIFDLIFDRQMFSVEEKAFLYAMLGRLMFPVNHKDSWQVFLWLVGKGGTGKSTVLKCLQAVFAPEDVAVVGNKPSDHFGLEGLDKLIFLGMDLGADFGLDQQVWQSMVSGERVAYYSKYQMAQTITWTTPGAFASNMFPKAWLKNNKQNQFGRRAVGVPFDHSINENEEKTDLFSKFLDHELGAFLHKIVSAYLSFVGRYGASIKSRIPEKFTETTKMNMASNNWLSQFISERCTVPQEGGCPDAYVCSKDDFHTSYLSFCSTNASCPRPAPTFNDQDLRNQNVEVVRDGGNIMYIGVQLNVFQGNASNFFNRR